jgi:hypothetical protein
MGPGSYSLQATDEGYKRTVFIGPVQTVEDYLNYTKLNYFSPPELEEQCSEQCAKVGCRVVFAHFL